MDYFFPFSVYVDPDVVSFSTVPECAEIGTSLAGITLRWELSKNPTGLKIDGVAISANEAVVYKTGPFTSNQTFKLTMSDEFKSVNAKATLQFLNKGYCGFVSAAPTNSAGILALERSSLVTGREFKATIGAPVNKVFCYAYPKRLGAPTKVLATTSNPIRSSSPTVTTTFANFTTSTVPFTNQHGYTEDYYVLTLNGPVPDPKGTEIEFE